VTTSGLGVGKKRKAIGKFTVQRHRITKTLKLTHRIIERSTSPTPLVTVTLLKAH
jgi:hypothetical protein